MGFNSARRGGARAVRGTAWAETLTDRADPWRTLHETAGEPQTRSLLPGSRPGAPTEHTIRSCRVDAKRARQFSAPSDVLRGLQRSCSPSCSLRTSSAPSAGHRSSPRSALHSTDAASHASLSDERGKNLSEGEGLLKRLDPDPSPAAPPPASPSSRTASRRARRPRGCRDTACSCPCSARAARVSATSHGRTPPSRSA